MGCGTKKARSSDHPVVQSLADNIKKVEDDYDTMTARNMRAVQRATDKINRQLDDYLNMISALKGVNSGHNT